MNCMILGHTRLLQFECESVRFTSNLEHEADHNV